MQLRSSRNSSSNAMPSQFGDGDEVIPPTYFVVCLHEKCTQEAADFMTRRLRAPQHEGGAELIVHQEEMKPDGLIIHVSANKVSMIFEGLRTRIFLLCDTIFLWNIFYNQSNFLVSMIFERWRNRIFILCDTIFLRNMFYNVILFHDKNINRAFLHDF